MTAPITTIKPRAIDITGDYVVNSISSTGNVTAGNLKTDHLLYANGTPYVFTTNAAGSNTQVQFNDGNSFAGDANLTFNKTTGTLTVAHLSGNGSAITNVNALTLNGHSDTYFATSTQGSKADTAIQPGDLSGYATQTDVGNAIANLVASAPSALDTLNELANALGNDASYSTTITNALANKLSTSSFSSTANTWIATQSTSNLSEGTNLYYTVARANTAIDNRVTKSFVDNLAVVANIANIAYSVDVSNVTGIGNIATINKDGNASNVLYGNGVFASLPGAYANSNVATFLASYGSNTIVTTGNVTVGNIIGNGQALTNITGANVTGQVGNALVAGTVYTAAQPNITSVGTLTSLSVTGNITSGNANLGNLVTANFFSGNGSLLTSLTGANVTGFVPNANVANTAYAVAGANVTGQVGNALIAGTVYTNAQPNITSVGTLTSLSVTGNVTAGNILTDHLLYANGTAFVFSMNAAGSNTQLQFNDGNSFAGSSSLTFNKTSNTLTVNNFVVSTTANLGAVGNIIVTGGTSGQVLSTDGAGTLSWATPSSSSSATIAIDNFTGNGVQTDFTLSVTPVSKNNITVNYNGALQLHSAYTLLGNVVTMTEAPANGYYLEITTISSLPVLSGGQFTTRTYTGDGTTTDFTVTNGVTVSSLLVMENGVVQTPTSDYTVSGSTLTFLTAPTNGMKIQIRELNTSVVANVNKLNADVANVKITGGTSGQALVTDGAGNISFGSAGVPSGKIVALNMFLGF